MTTMIVEEMAQIPMSPYLVATLKRAAEYAEAQAHLKVTLEHTLLALTEDPEASIILKSSSVEIERLQSDISNFLGNIQERQDPQNAQQLVTDGELKRVLEAAAAAAQQGHRNEMNGAILLAAIIGDGQSNAAHILSAQGLTFDEVISALQSQMRASATPVPDPATDRAPTDQHQAPSAPPPQSQSADQTQTSAPAAANDSTSDISPPRPAAPPPSTPSAEPSMPQAPAAAHHGFERQSSATLSATTDEILATARQRVGSRQTETQNGQPPLTNPGPSSFEEGSAARALTPDWQPIAASVPPPTETNRNQPASRPPPPLGPEPGRTPDNKPSHGGQLRNTPPLSHRVPPPVSPSAGLTPPMPPQTATAAQRTMPAAGAASIAAPPQLKRGGPMVSPASAPPWSGPSGDPHPSSRPGAPSDNQRRQQPTNTPRSTRIDIDTGALEDSIPSHMRARVPTLVEVRLARTGVKALAEGLEFSGAVHRRDSHLITKALSVKLRAPDGGFWVEAASPETQWIENVLGVMTDDYVSWRWLVTPKAKGLSRLQLVVSARTVGTDGLAAETAVPDRIFDVRIARNYRKLAANLGGWLLAAAFGAAAVWFAGPLIRIAKQTLITFLTSANW